MHARFYAPQLSRDCSTVELPPDEAEHLGRVLRLLPGADVRLFDGQGHEFEGRVESVGRSRVAVTVGAEVPPRAAEPRVRLVLGQALLKGDAMDQVVRDAVMLGASRVIPLDTEHAEMPARRVVQSGRVSRWQRIAVSSAKQCGRALVPEVTPPQQLAGCLQTFQGEARFLLAEPALADLEARFAAPVRIAASDEVLLLVGPEGGWSAGEVASARAAGCRPLTLGSRTLRADAAALVGLTALWCFLGEFGPRTHSCQSPLTTGFGG
jgi:16S rRNA (uracil1498-N3)-methyltransferase